MTFQWFYICFMAVMLIYDAVTFRIVRQYRKNPLPEEVADVYDAERYQTFLSYKNDNGRLFVIKKAVSTGIDLIVLFSGLFQFLDQAIGNHLYLLYLVTMAILSLISEAVSYIADYYSTFTIAEKYKLNKKTRAEFNHDELLNFGMELLMMSVLGAFMIFLCTNLGRWTNGFAISYLKSFWVCLLIAGAFLLLALLLSLLSLAALRKQYTFHDLEAGELRTRIEALIKDTHKKVKKITVYNESKKSVNKNAFVLKLLWYREISIADNFLDENSEDELLAVIAHECGHLKHRKDLFNWIQYGFLALLFALLVWLLPNAAILTGYTEWIKASFHLQYDNYYLMMLGIMAVGTPLGFLFSLYGNWRSRREEYEADRNAVSCGYGRAMIKMFKQLSSDELVDANPSPVIEFLEYDHPGMYQRIHALNHAISQYEKSK